MIDLGLEPYRLAASLKGILAQRLVRQLCPKCKKKEKARSVTQWSHLKLPGKRATKTTTCAPVGCEACGDTGYKGRFAAVEMLKIDRSVRPLISETQPESALYDYTINNKIQKMSNSVYEKYIDGLTSFEEVEAILLEEIS